ncbi:high-affinity iron permease [Cladochytrium tenue]|nr:high-affinity iron permease [Cladochytrium tenue]
MFGVSIPLFFVIFREATESAVVVSVLATFIRRGFSSHPIASRSLFRLLWLGTAVGGLAAILIGTAFLVVFFKYANNLWSSAESLWEGCFSLLASILITVMAISFLEAENIVEKWERKMRKGLAGNAEFMNALRANADAVVPATAQEDNDEITAIGKPEDDNGTAAAAESASVASNESRLSFFDAIASKILVYFRFRRRGQADASPAAANKRQPGRRSVSAENVMFVLPMVTVLREGLEGMIFVGGVGVSTDWGSIPMAAALGIVAGVALGYTIYRAGSAVRLRTFFVAAAIFLLFLGSGLLVKAVLQFQSYRWQRVLGIMNDDTATSYDLFATMWYLQCCNPGDPNSTGWQLFSAVFGWSNQGTYASIASYITYWLVIAFALGFAKISRRRSNGVRRLRREGNGGPSTTSADDISNVPGSTHSSSNTAVQ